MQASSVIIDKHVVIQPGTVIGHDPEEDANRFETTEDGIVVIPKGAEIGWRPQDSGNHFRVGRFSKSGGLADAVGALSQQLVPWATTWESSLPPMLPWNSVIRLPRSLILWGTLDPEKSGAGCWNHPWNRARASLPRFRFTWSSMNTFIPAKIFMVRMGRIPG